ncbi:MAG: hypothetical protein K9M97_12720 [Akkermansiaceae bacterium]|nr:hypothetical protein [Akkermansiaceae bacterium]
MRFSCRRFLALAAGLTAATLGLTEPARADIPAGNVLFTVGTTFTSGGQSHVYLLWTPTDDDLLRLRAFSVWSKAGGANSPAEFQPESWIKVQTEPTVIEAALRRAEKLGQDLTKLEAAIDGLFDIFTPGATMTRSEKLSMILQGAQQDARLYHDLLVLARLHPAISLCLGAAYAGPANGLRTYEVRMAGPDDGPQAPAAARRVVGRVTLNPAAYQPLPAPGAPVPVPFGRWKDGVFQRDARGNLNARMRWATPDPLRQQALLQFGYQVYRVDPTFYHSSGMDAGTMQAGDLANYATAFPTLVKRASRSPVLIERMLTAAEAADQRNDPDTYFFIDDNRRFDPGGVPFNDGDEFQYLITAIDILGRDGLPSPASLLQICRTVGPNPPRNLTVRDQVTHPTDTSTRQVFGLSWQSPVAVAEAPVTRYDIYRWANSSDPVTPTVPLLKVGSVPAQAGVEWYTFEDASLGVAPDVSEFNKPWWFTVRAVTEGACGAVPSPHGAPASGVLRKRSGPVAATQPSTVTITKSVPTLKVNSINTWTNLTPADPGFLNVKITLNRSSFAIDAADYYYRIDNTSPAGEGEVTPLGPAPVGAVYLGSVRFKATGDPQRSTSHRIALPDTGTHTVTFHLRTRDRHGNLSEFGLDPLGAVPTLSSASNDHVKNIVATASHSYQSAVAPVGFSAEKHISRPLGQANIATPTLQLKISSATKVWKVYRRIDQGPLVLSREGTGTPLPDEPTSALAVNSGEVSYFLQLLDANGFARPMAEIGHFQMTSVEPPPQPMVLPLEALPARHAILRWACSPHGVGRFHIGVAGLGITPADSISPQLSPAFENRAGVPVTIDGKAVELAFRIYDTGPLLGNSSPEQEINLTLEDGVSYFFFVEAVATSGERGLTSNLVPFAWIDPVDGGPDALWPARPSPQLNTAFTMPPTGDASEAGIIIGGLPEGTTVEQVGNTVRLWPSCNLWDSLRREKGRPERRLLPCVVYRYQLPKDRFPKVSGDVSQVAPLLKNIAARSETLVPTGGGAARTYTVVYDPYFKFDATNRLIRLHVPQPKIAYATYRYLMVLFRDDGEVDSVVPTSTFTMDIN